MTNRIRWVRFFFINICICEKKAVNLHANLKKRQKRFCEKENNHCVGRVAAALTMDEEHVFNMTLWAGGEGPDNQIKRALEYIRTGN